MLLGLEDHPIRDAVAHDGDSLCGGLFRYQDNFGHYHWLDLEHCGLRAYAYDAPELRTLAPDGTQPGLLAKAHFEQLVASGQLVARLLLGDHDKFGRVLARLFVDLADGTRLDVANEMIHSGHGTAYSGGTKTLSQATGLASPLDPLI